jgi:AcrR family transcriptional regulator
MSGTRGSPAQLICLGISPMYEGKESPMLDQSTAKGRLLAAALDQAAKKPWGDVTLLDIAEGAGVPLADLRTEFTGKTDIIAALLRAVDDEVLKRTPSRSEGQEKRDALFDIIMTRFDVLGPYKPALKSIYASGAADFSLAGPYLASQHWMLQSAGIGTDGATGALRVAGLGLTYASVFRIWLEDDDAGLARTMAALDRRLRRGQQTLDGLEQFGAAFSRFGAAMQDIVRGATQGRPKKEAGPDTRAP